MHHVTTGARDTGEPLAKHGQAATRIKAAHPSNLEVSGCQTCREETEGSELGTEGTEK